MERPPVVTNDKLLGIGLAAFSLIVAVGTGIYFIRLRENVPLTLIALPAFGFLMGMAILFFDFVEKGLGIQEEIEQAVELLQDDIEALRQFKFTATHAYVALTLLAVGSEVVMVARYQKWLARWGFVNVLFLAMIVVVVVTWLGLRSHWFRYRQQRFAARVFAIPAAGFLICAILGTYYAEPMEYGGLSRLDRTQLIQSAGYWGSTRASRVWYIADWLDAGAGVLEIDCDGEACLILLLAVIVVLCVMGVLFIPHFWVLATLLLLALMGLIATRELLFHEKHRPRMPA